MLLFYNNYIMKKSIIVLFSFIFILFSQANAFEVDDWYGNKIQCKPDVYTHCEPIDPIPAPVPEPAPNPTPIPEPAPAPSPSPEIPKPVIEQKAYVYIKYFDKAWRKIYATSTYEWKNWEVLDLTKYKKDLVTFKFVWYKPENWQITLVWWRYLNAELIYEKDYKEATDSSVYPKPETNSINTTTTTNILTEKEQIRQEQINTLHNVLDNYFTKKNIDEEKRILLVSSLQELVKKRIDRELNEAKKELYKLLYDAFDAYN